MIGRLIFHLPYDTSHPLGPARLGTVKRTVIQVGTCPNNYGTVLHVTLLTNVILVKAYTPCALRVCEQSTKYSTYVSAYVSVYVTGSSSVVSEYVTP